MTAISAPPLPNIFDFAGLADIKRAARGNDPQATKAAARQFEAMFMQMVLKSMREATPQDSLFGSEQTRFYESLLDQQLGQALAGRGNGLGLAAMIEVQLGRKTVDPVASEGGLPTRPLPRAFPVEPAHGPRPLNGDEAAVPAQKSGGAKMQSTPFVSVLMPEAMVVSDETGIPAHFMIAQAALETGWGRSMPRRSDGSPSFNLFGIKAGRDWSGPVAEAGTTEYVNGLPERRVQRFRAYASFAESFRDYAHLLTSNSRYSAVLNADSPAAFARNLQQAGYATDPAYAVKLERIISAIS